jgi:hypothetical protein
MTNEDTEKIEVHRGLKGVYFDRSRVCFIDRRRGLRPAERHSADHGHGCICDSHSVACQTRDRSRPAKRVDAAPR